MHAWRSIGWLPQFACYTVCQHNTASHCAGRVGKTSLLLRWAHDSFDAAQPPTLQASFLAKTLTIDGSPVEVNVWDTAGQERFRSLGPIYYRGADAAVLVYDVTSEASFARVRSWIKELKQMVRVRCHPRCDSRCCFYRGPLARGANTHNISCWPGGRQHSAGDRGQQAGRGPGGLAGHPRGGHQPGGGVRRRPLPHLSADRRWRRRRVPRRSPARPGSPQRTLRCCARYGSLRYL